jgi:GNAT superfamily N-acetyltransferase
VIVSRIVGGQDQAARDSETRQSPQASRGSTRVRPIIPSDLRPLMESIGPLVDALYPAGAARLFCRLEDALAGHATAYVVATRADTPIALAAEAPKGGQARKLSTFWVSPVWRRRGIGSKLIAHRVHSWLSQEVISVHVTVRQKRSLELIALLGPWGFGSAFIDLDRYGEGENELILIWRSEYMYCPRPLVKSIPGLNIRHEAV